MRVLAFGLTAAALLAAAPASAQTVYVDDGYRGGPTYGYRYGYNYREPGVEVRIGSPRARVYVEEDAPRYRRGYGYDGYAYDNGYRSWGGPTVRVGRWRGDWDW